MAFVPPIHLRSTVLIFSIFTMATVSAQAQQDQLPLGKSTPVSSGEKQSPVDIAPLCVKNHESESSDSPHSFLDRTNILLFSGVAVSRALDYTSTRNMLARGREERLIPDDVVNSTPGFVSLEAAGTAASIGISYLLHRTGHHKLERWLSIGHISVTAFGAAHNYALESRHP